MRVFVVAEIDIDLEVVKRYKGDLTKAAAWHTTRAGQAPTTVYVAHDSTNLPDDL